MRSRQKCYEGKREKDTRHVEKLVSHYGLQGVLEMLVASCRQLGIGSPGYCSEDWRAAEDRMREVANAETM